MSTETNKFQVGVFVIVASVLGVVALVWLGATKFFEETETFVTYFSESVQGLDPGSAVKFRGVPAGRVGAIHIAPDNNLIEVVLDVDTDAAAVIKTDPRFRVKLELTGITGLRYIEIERREGQELNEAPLLNFETPYPVIPSAQSRFAAVQVALADMYDRVMQLDLAGLSSDGRHALQSADAAFDEARRVVQDRRIDRILEHLDEATATAGKLANNLEKATAGLDIAPAIGHANEAALEARNLFTSLNRVTSEEIKGAARDLALLAQSAQQVMTGLQYSLDRLDRTVGSLRGLADEVRGQPSRLLFQEPPDDRRTQGGKK